MSYVVESASSRRARRRRRTAITLLVVVAMLAGAFYVAASYGRTGRGSVAAGCPTTSTSTGTTTARATPPPKPPAKPASAAPTKAPKATAKPPLPSQVTVNVYNATGRAGLAGDAAKEVRARGFVVGTVANDPLKKPVAGTGEVRYGPNGSAAAGLTHRLLPTSRTVLDGRADGSVDLVLGNGFTALAPAPPVTATPTPDC